LSQENSPYQFVALHNHRVNTSECAFQSWKNPFISSLCTTDRDFPTQLWDQLLPQAQDTLDLLRASRIDPSKSAYDVLEGEHNFDRYLIAPPGTKAVINEPADSRASWAPRATDVWYVGAAKDHYCAAKFFVPETSAYNLGVCKNVSTTLQHLTGGGHT